MNSTFRNITLHVLFYQWGIYSPTPFLISPTSLRIFQYLQYWYNQYFLESSSICNTGITSIFQNLPVSAILVPGSSGICNTHILAMTIIFQYCRYWKILEDTGILVFTSICTSIADTGRFWQNTGNTSIVYNTGNTSIAAGCFILSKYFNTGPWINFSKYSTYIFTKQ